MSTTALQIGGTIGVAAFGTMYFALTGPATSATAASHGFAITAVCFGVTALIAAAMGHLATRPPPDRHAAADMPDQGAVDPACGHP